MKYSIKRSFWAILICGMGCFASCADMLETSTNSYLDTNDNLLHSANDSLYSVIGIVKQLQTLGERYVVLGELRGELTETTKNANMDLQAVADFTAAAGNPYLSTREYYTVINNCNYFLQHVDTTIISAGKKIMLGEYATVKAIRAWTYLQLGVNFGKATWLTEPILNIDDMNRQYEELSLENLLPRLIADIAPYENLEDYPSYGSSNINNLPVTASLIDIPVILSELLMWQGAYSGDVSAYMHAANIYYRWFTTSGRIYRATYMANMYSDSEFRYAIGDWNGIYGNIPFGYISLIRYNGNAQSQNFSVPPLTLLCLPSNTSGTYMIKPSQAAMSLWDNEIYAIYRSAQKDVLYNKGDLRGYAVRSSNSVDPVGSYAYVDTNEADSLPYITKYGYYFQNYSGTSGFATIYNVSLFREGKMYLRYAEALNALGKPSLAFAVLKYGLDGNVLTDPAKINLSEINPLPAYCNFMDNRFTTNYNRGFHGRGSGCEISVSGNMTSIYGNVGYDTIYYAFTPETLTENSAYYGFPETLTSRTDSMMFVNSMICKELGLETAFEGNRFQDLMRLSKTHQKLTGKSDFLAKWVGRRNPALESKLVNPDNWYLPFK